MAAFQQSPLFGFEYIIYLICLHRETNVWLVYGLQSSTSWVSIQAKNNHKHFVCLYFHFLKKIKWWDAEKMYLFFLFQQNSMKMIRGLFKWKPVNWKSQISWSIQEEAETVEPSRTSITTLRGNTRGQQASVYRKLTETSPPSSTGEAAFLLFLRCVCDRCDISMLVTT